MIGLDIRVKNCYSNYLCKLLEGVILFDYFWEIVHEDFIYLQNGKLKSAFFGKHVLNSGEFAGCISRDNYYMIFADIKAYPINSDLIEIRTFEDFMKSSCEMVILCTDTSYIEFYSKDRKILDRVYNNCIKYNFEKAEYRSLEDVSNRSLVAW